MNRTYARVIRIPFGHRRWRLLSATDHEDAVSPAPDYLIHSRPFTGSTHLRGTLIPKSLSSSMLTYGQWPPSSKIIFRTKRHKAGSVFDKRDDDGKDEDEDGVIYTIDETEDIGNELVVNVASLRLDNILRAGVKKSASELETAFYESRIRINGKRPLKKSALLQLGDEVDFVIGQNESTDRYLDVTRIKLIAVRFPKTLNSTSHITVKMQRYKTLTIENYEDNWSNLTR